MNTITGDIPTPKYRDDDNEQFWLDGESDGIITRMRDGFSDDERTGRQIKYRIKNGRASLSVEDFSFITRLARKQAGPIPCNWPKYVYDQ